MSNKKLFITATIIIIVVGGAILLYGQLITGVEQQAGLLK